jgi:ATP-independent RNA helicase DbpA
MATFDTITEIPTALLKTLNTLQFTQMTKVQEESIRPILEGKDLLAQSKTGSGKTLAFGIPIIINADISTNTPQTLIIAPTRELVQQIANAIRQIAAYKPNLKIVTLYGGVPLRIQADSLSKGSHILIGTPGRIMDHLGKGTLKLDSIKNVVLDEADKMLDMGFYDDIIKIDDKIPNREQTLLFSATFPPKIESLSSRLLKDPVNVKIETVHDETAIEQTAFKVSDKFSSLLTLLQSFKPKSVLLFCNTKEEVINLTQKLNEHGHDAIDLQGNLTQKERDESVICFSNGSKPILVATDVASRGLDINEIELVINYDLPFDQETYTHRIGRTGRAGAKGTALSLFTPNEANKCRYITSNARTGDIDTLKGDSSFTLTSEFLTLCLNGGKKSKLRKGDILGTFCKEIGIEISDIGKIDITPTHTYIALHKEVTAKVRKALKSVKIKKKKYLSWIVD